MAARRCRPLASSWLTPAHVPAGRRWRACAPPTPSSLLWTLWWSSSTAPASGGGLRRTWRPSCSSLWRRSWRSSRGEGGTAAWAVCHSAVAVACHACGSSVRLGKPCLHSLPPTLWQCRLTLRRVPPPRPRSFHVCLQQALAERNGNTAPEGEHDDRWAHAAGHVHLPFSAQCTTAHRLQAHWFAVSSAVPLCLPAMLGCFRLSHP